MFRLHTSARRIRAAVLSAAIVGAGLAGVLGTAGAAHAGTDGYVTTFVCNSATGKIAYQPGLLQNTAQTTNATLSGFIAGCHGSGGPTAGLVGTLTTSMSGNASLGSENFSGSFTINWPPAMNPSTGTLAVTDSNGTLSVSGQITGGTFTGSVIQMSYVITSQHGKGTALNPVTSQTFLSAQQPLTVLTNLG